MALKRSIQPLSLVLLVGLSCSEGKFSRGTSVPANQPLEEQEADQVAQEVIPSQIMNLPALTPAEIVVEEVPVEKEKTKVEQKPLFADCPDAPDRMIVADLYQLPATTQMLPDYSTLTSIKKICLSQLDITIRDFSAGFPGVTDLFEWFSLDNRFIVKVPRDGLYSFKLIADDGAKLYIDDQLVVDNDGVHAVAEKIGSKELKAGEVNFRVSYFQGPRFGIALELKWQGPDDTDYTYIPKGFLKRPLN